MIYFWIKLREEAFFDNQPRYQENEDIHGNLKQIGLNPKMISQFDIIINMDEALQSSEETNKEANHILYEFMKDYLNYDDKEPTNKNNQPKRYSLSELRNLFEEVRDLNPKITVEVIKYIEEYLILLDKASYDEKNSMIRLVAAHAKLCQREITTMFDVISIIALKERVSYSDK